MHISFFSGGGGMVNDIFNFTMSYTVICARININIHL